MTGTAGCSLTPTAFEACHTGKEAKKRRREIQVEFKEKKKQAWPLKKLLAALLSCEEKQLPARTSFWL